MQSRKAVLRGHLRAVRAALTDEQHAAASAAICARLLELNFARSFYKIGVYLATPEEANIDAFAASLLARGVTVAAPRTGKRVENSPPLIKIGGRAVPSFYTLSDLRAGVRPGSFGVREPLEYPGGVHYRPEELDLIIAPGLAFDARGGRLGFGGGWYDRALQRGVLQTGTLALGVCFDCQIVDMVPRAEHDVPVATIVTENRIIDVEGLLAARLGRIDVGGVGNGL
ncbi:MAG TPA: 5-formyltetrahydrofolate cyclo-ligase [Abditibacteriaceae bacterium]|nr:5-formyltetrahydrofolate cyclo-ligase [Abditibacteriaceae bacterium]